jgi:phospholipase C
MVYQGAHGAGPEHAGGRYSNRRPACTDCRPTDQANHQYDLTNFYLAALVGRLPAVSFLKAPAYEDGHAGYSDPLDEQRFLANTINFLQLLPTWKDTAVIIAYDDSDGWYDHVMGPIVSQSNGPGTSCACID